jgi:hypothetical protein
MDRGGGDHIRPALPRRARESLSLCERDRSLESSRRRVKPIGLDPTLFAGHSLRSGYISTAADHGASLQSIANHAGHEKIDTTLGYVQVRDAFRDHSGKSFLGVHVYAKDLWQWKLRLVRCCHDATAEGRRFRNTPCRQNRMNRARGSLPPSTRARCRSRAALRQKIGVPMPGAAALAQPGLDLHVLDDKPSNRVDPGQPSETQVTAWAMLQEPVHPQ